MLLIDALWGASPPEGREFRQAFMQHGNEFVIVKPNPPAGLTMVDFNSVDVRCS